MINGMAILTLVVSFLGGGVVSGLIGWIYTYRTERQQRKIRFIDEQVRKLYGPLYYFTSQNEKLISLYEKHFKAFVKVWKEERSQQKITDRNTGKKKEKKFDFDKVFSKTFENARKFIEEIEKNNEKIKQILDDSYSYIDPEDIDIFLDFFEYYIRRKKENKKEKKLCKIESIEDFDKYSFDIKREVGKISIVKKEFWERVKLKFFQKKEELNKLMGCPLKSNFQNEVESKKWKKGNKSKRA